MEVARLLLERGANIEAENKYVSKRTCVYVCLYVFICVCLFDCLSVCVCVCAGLMIYILMREVYVCLCVCVWLSV